MIRLLLLVLLLFGAVFQTPSKDESDNSPGSLSGLKPCPEEKCYFSIHHKMIWETKTRPELSQVSSKCSNNLQSLSHYMSTEKIDPKTGENNTLALLLCRGTGECDLDFSDPKVVDYWKNIFICDHHAEELLTKWSSPLGFRDKHIYRTTKKGKEETVCSMPEGIGLNHKGTRPGPDRLKVLKIQESDALNKQLGYLVHPGIPVCENHKKFVEELVSKNHPLPQKRTRLQSGFYANSDEGTCPRDTAYVGPPTKKKRTQAGFALQQFAEYMDIDRVCFPSKDFERLSERSQQKKMCSVHKLYDAMVEVVAGDDAVAFRKKMLIRLNANEQWATGSSENFEAIMKQTAEQYMRAEDRKSRVIILSIVANSVPYLTVEKYIPSLSRFLYTEARKFARRNKDIDLNAPEKKMEKYNRDAVQLFVDFITSSSIMIGLPYGVRKVKLTNGTKIEIPNTIRQQSSTEIYEMYTNLLESTNQTHLRLSRSTVFNILAVCEATDRKATNCVDYFTANGMEAFDGLHSILDVWAAEELIDADELKILKTGLFEAAQYLRTDFRLHVKKCSRVPDHCATLALSDPSNKNMNASCSNTSYHHVYDLRCNRCERVNIALQEVKEYSTELTKHPSGANQLSQDLSQRRKEENVLITNYIEDIFEMKKHYLRAAFTSQEREDIIHSLGDNEVFITMDFAQKYLPRWHREKQNDYFGKKGYPIIFHTLLPRLEKYTPNTALCTSTRTKCPNKLVVLTLYHVLSELKKVGISAASLRSDNAGCYHSSNTINALLWLSETTGVRIKTYTFSEAQNGKSSSDRDASRVKRKAESYVTKGSDITTPSHFFNALKEGKLLNGVSIHLGTVNVTDSGDSKWPGIASLNHFEVEENGIRGRRYGGIGNGEFLPKQKLKPMKGSHNFSDAGFLLSASDSVDVERSNVIAGLQTKFWYYSECKTGQNKDLGSCIEENDDVAPEIDENLHTNRDSDVGKLFYCPEVGCSSSFLKPSNLEKHLLRGKHRISPEKITLHDIALKFFSRNIEEVDSTRTCPIIGDAINEFKETSNQTSLYAGWALPLKQQRKPFEKHVKEFLVKMFNEGLKKKRLDPRTIEKRMRTEKNPDGSLMFSVEERKDAKQIAGFLSREAEKMRSTHKHRHRHRRYQDKASSMEYVVDPEDHEDFGWIKFIKDEAFFTEADEFFEAIQERDDLFLQ